jgi:hypothetical protein
MKQSITNTFVGMEGLPGINVLKLNLTSTTHHEGKDRIVGIGLTRGCCTRQP